MKTATSLALAAALGLVSACKRKHIPVSSVTELPYPSCPAGTSPAAEVLSEGVLRAGHTSLERDVVERFSLRRRDCLVVGSVHQSWRMAVTDVEVVYDADLLPLRAWRRIAVPGVHRADGAPDIRRYELRTPEVSVKRRTSDGEVSYEVLRGQRPRAVIATGRGLLTAWIRRAHLREGETLREWVLDLRSPLEELRPVTLRRERDQTPDWLGHAARVYTIYGREPVFADENDTVLGDLSGLRPDALANTPRPPPLPEYGAPDPEHTP